MKAMTRRHMLQVMGISSVAAALAACTPQVVKETVIVEKEVEKVVTKVVKEVVKETVVVEGKPKEVTRVVEKVVEKVVTARPAAKAPVEITFIECWFGIPQFPKTVDVVAKAISEKMQDEGLNVELRCLILDDHKTKYPVLYASGADFTMAFDAPWYKMNSLRDQGYLLPLDNLIEEYGPNIKKLVTEEVLETNKMFGHTYGIPAYFYFGQTRGAIIREDLREKYGAPEPTEGWESLEPFLKAIKENEPDMIPLACLGNRKVAMDSQAWPTVACNIGGVPGCAIPDIWTEPKLSDAETADFFRPSCELQHKWWELGYVNKTDLQAAEVFSAPETLFYPGKCAAVQDDEPGYQYTNYQEGLAKTIPGAKAKGYDMSGQRSGKVKKIRFLRQYNFVVFNALQPGDKRIAGIQFFNWIMGDQDNIDMWLFGIDGVNYKKDPNMRFSEIPGTDAARNYRRMWYVSGCPGKVQRLAKDLPKYAEEAVKFLSTPENFRYHPLQLFLADTKPIEAELATVRAATAEATAELKLGSIDVDEGIAFFKKTMDAAGRQKLKATMQAQLDAWAENIG